MVSPAATSSLHRIERLNYLLGAILCIGAALRYPTPISLGVAVGVALTCVNFFFLRRLVSRWTADAARGAGSGSMLLVLPKMAGLMVAVVLSLALLPIDPIGFVAGYSIFVVSVIIEAVYSVMAPPPALYDASGPRDPQNPDEHNNG